MNIDKRIENLCSIQKQNSETILQLRSNDPEVDPIEKLALALKSFGIHLYLMIEMKNLNEEIIAESLV